MLVYANSVQLEPEEGVDQIIRAVARWVGVRSGPGSFVDPERLLAGIRELKLKDGSTLTSRSTFESAEETEYPRFFSARFSHADGDGDVSHRRWSTEIGLRQDTPAGPIDCSVLLRTEEFSAKAATAVKVTRPRLMESLFETCRPVQTTPGLFLKTLDTSKTEHYLASVTNEDRRAPIVVISPFSNGQYPISAERVRTLVLGLADVYEIPDVADTYQLEKLIGRRFFAFNGAIRIIFPKSYRGDYYDAPLLSGELIAELAKERGAAESEILSILTHRLNLGFSYRHISIEFINQVILRLKLRRIFDNTGANNETTLEENKELLALAYEELNEADAKLSEKNEECRKLVAAVESLQYSLSDKQFSNTTQTLGAEDLIPIKGLVSEICNNTLTLESVIRSCAILFSDRVLVLESAYSSAQASDRSGFKYAEKALDLLNKLLTDYWEVLNAGGNDQQAKVIFGNEAYAANEGNLSRAGKDLRKFSHNGTRVQMDKHLKHGVKDSAATTLRIHFEWFPDSRKFVIGHCGKHLDF